MTLDFFNFGNDMKRWVSTFYKNSSACVCNNGYSTGFFPVRRGVRQGCPLSPYLFLLCAELLAKAVITNDLFKGIRIHGNDCKVLSYADDTTFILDGSAGTFNEMISILEDFK